jgi:SecD/SecF fusion protein
MSPAWTFTFGLVLMLLFGWYIATEIAARKRILGTLLSVLVTAFCFTAFNPPSQKIQLGIDLKGGTTFLIRLVPEKGEESKINKDTVDQAVEVIRKRVDSYGVGEPVISPEGKDRIMVQIPGLDPAKTAAARVQLQKVAKLEFHLVNPQSDQLISEIQAGTAIIPPGYRIADMIEHGDKGKPAESKILIKTKADLLGSSVTRAGASLQTQGWEVDISFDSAGGQKFYELTKQVHDENSRLAIVMDGVVISAPTCQNGAISGGNCQITGNFTEDEARNLASSLNNPLATPVIIEEERSSSSTLGADAIKSGVYSGIAGLALVVVFMVLYYRIVGFIAIVALCINCVMVLGAMAMFNSVLTLPGIAGIILGIGIAVDANVLIYERLREELDAGKSLKPAIDASYSKAFSAIFDAHVTQFLTAAILFWFASGPVKGFALTLTIGIVASMFSSLLITHTCFSWAFHFNWLKRISMLHLIRSKRFDFLGNARPFILASVVLVVASIAIFALRGERNFGADFKGGDLISFSSTEKIETDQVRKDLAAIGLQNSVIQAEKSATRDLISIRSDSGTAEKIKTELLKAHPGSGLTFEQTDHVGSLVGGELATKSAIALALGMVGIFLYVSLRFEASFAVGSLIALAHDLIITLGIFALSGRELSLIMVGAFLTIAGYSINDKIVVFDRIRSGLRNRTAGSVRQVMNTSINETLSRTILTGGTVLLTVLALYLFGGAVLNDFAFAFLIGVIVGTYSSIFIASAIVLWWSGHKGGSLQREVKAAPSAPATT